MSHQALTSQGSLEIIARDAMVLDPQPKLFDVVVFTRHIASLEVCKILRPYSVVLDPNVQFQNEEEMIRWLMKERWESNVQSYKDGFIVAGMTGHTLRRMGDLERHFPLALSAITARLVVQGTVPRISISVACEERCGLHQPPLMKPIMCSRLDSDHFMMRLQPYDGMEPSGPMIEFPSSKTEIYASVQDLLEILKSKLPSSSMGEARENALTLGRGYPNNQVVDLWAVAKTFTKLYDLWVFLSETNPSGNGEEDCVIALLALDQIPFGNNWTTALRSDSERRFENEIAIQDLDELATDTNTVCVLLEPSEQRRELRNITRPDYSVLNDPPEVDHRRKRVKWASPKEGSELGKQPEKKKGRRPGARMSAPSEPFGMKPMPKSVSKAGKNQDGRTGGHQGGVQGEFLDEIIVRSVEILDDSQESSSSSI